MLGLLTPNPSKLFVEKQIENKFSTTKNFRSALLSQLQERRNLPSFVLYKKMILPPFYLSAKQMPGMELLCGPISR